MECGLHCSKCCREEHSYDKLRHELVFSHVHSITGAGMRLDFHFVITKKKITCLRCKQSKYIGFRCCYMVQISNFTFTLLPADNLFIFSFAFFEFYYSTMLDLFSSGKEFRPESSWWLQEVKAGKADGWCMRLIWFRSIDSFSRLSCIPFHTQTTRLLLHTPCQQIAPVLWNVCRSIILSEHHDIPICKII